MADTERLKIALKNADAAGDEEAARKIASALKRQRTQRQPQQTASSPEGRSAGQEAVRTLGRGARYAIEGASAIPNMLAQPIVDATNYASEKLGGPQVFQPNQMRALSEALTSAGLPEDETAGERVTGDIARAMMAGGGIVGVAQRLRGPLAKALSSAPGTQLAAETAGAASAGGVREAGGGPTMQTVAGLAAGVGAPLTAQRAMSAGRSMTPTGRQTKMQGRAREQVMRELENSGMSVEEAQQHLRRNPDLVLGDLSDNLSQRTATVATKPGPAAEKAKDVLVPRYRDQLERISPAIRKGLGEDARYMDAVEELQTSMRQRARPLYDQAYKTPLEPTDRMRKLVEAIPKEAFNKAKKLAKTENVELELRPDNLIDTRSLDYVLRGLSDIEGTALRSGSNQYAKALGSVRRDLVESINDQNPAFGQARRVWSGGKADEEALQLGRKALREDSEELGAAVDKMSESEKKHFRIGVMKGIENTIEGMSVNRDLVKKFRDVPKIRKALKASFKDDESYDEFMQMLDDEAAMVETYTKARVGSRTTPLAESNAQLKRNFVGMMLRGLISGGSSAKFEGVSMGAQRLFRDPEETSAAFRSSFGDMLLSNKPDLQGPVRQSTRPQAVTGAAIGAATGDREDKRRQLAREISASGSISSP